MHRKHEDNCVGCQYNTGTGRSQINSRSGSGFVTVANIFECMPIIYCSANDKIVYVAALLTGSAKQ